MAPKQPVAGPSRPKASTSAAAQSPPPPASISSFNPTRSQFALALPVLGSADKLAIWDVTADRLLVEWEVEGASKVSTLCWTSVPSSKGQGKRKRPKHEAGADDGDEDVVVLTNEKSQAFVFSPKRGLLRKLDLPSSVTASWSSERGVILASASSLYLLSPDAGSISHTFALPTNTPAPSAVAALPSTTADILRVLVASISVLVLSLNVGSGKVTETSSPLPVSTSSVTSLLPLPSSPQGTSFLVVSADDRTVSQYTLPAGQNKAKLSYRYASPTLAPAHSVSSTPSHVSVLHVSGEISVFNVPKELDFARPKSDSKPGVVKVVEGKDERQSRICRAAFALTEAGEPGALLVGRMAGAGRLRWHRATFEQPEGGMRTETLIKCDAQDLVAQADSKTTPIQRFAAPTAVAEIAEPDTGDDPSSTLPADVDMADLSLGERLLALPNGGPNGDVKTPKSKASAAALDGPVNAASLTRLLVQALHTSDPALLSVCLSHRDPVLIRNTIRKMPAQMALPLLKACVERLGQGKGANRRGGSRGAAQNEQQGRGTVEWVKGVLVERGAILMTMPSLPLHVANLSQLLNTRLQLYQPLLSLSGRLDLALAQITMRRIAAEQAEAMKLDEGKRGEGERYVEGESEDEDDDEVVIEVGDGDGEIEDVDMRAFGSE